VLMCYPGPTPPSVLARSRLASPSVTETTERWIAAMELLTEDVGSSNASLTRAQQLTLLHPRWQDLWTQSGWSLRRRRIDDAVQWRRSNLGSSALAAELVGFADLTGRIRAEGRSSIKAGPSPPW